jgi:hypothetical protein
LGAEGRDVLEDMDGDLNDLNIHVDIEREGKRKVKCII